MNFYNFHIGDYASRTGHLEPMEDLAYRRLLDLYYVRESPLPDNPAEVAKLIRLREHEDLIRSVLGEFFHLTNRGWEHERCEEVVASAQEKRSKAQSSAVMRWQSERIANAVPGQSDGNAPIPIPIPIPKKTEGAVALLLSRGISQTLAEDFNALRKAKKCPLTASALEGIQREAEKAHMSLEKALQECCQRGWAGFKAAWMDGSRQPATGRSNDTAEDTRRMLADKDVGTRTMPAEVRQIAAQLTGRKSA